MSTADLGRPVAHWLTADTLAWAVDPAATTYRLYAAPTGGLFVDDSHVLGGSAYPLARDVAGLSKTLAERYPHLTGLGVLRLSGRISARSVRELLTGQVAVAAFDSGGTLLGAAGLQTAGALDDVYPGATARILGPTWKDGVPTLSVWAPTAKDVTLHLYPSGAESPPAATVPLTRSGDGVWTVTGPPSWNGHYYLFEVEVYVPETGGVEHNLVTDPYSVALSTNSVRSQLADLDDPALAPDGWLDLVKPRKATRSIYELHVRDFSIGDESVPAEHRGTYLAFAEPAGAGMAHLARLAEAGLTTVHLLPTADFATVDDVRARHETPPGNLASYPSDSDQQQAAVTAVAATDGFNWGYDPLHWTTPEGSYATDPEGTARTREFRAMVAALNRAGLRVVMDVVYNHTSCAGQGATNNLDRIVPGYYHRLDAQGAPELSTCCPGTATEHAMMGKLLIDSVLTWATQYKVDGFRFDLMGHQPKSLMVALRRALDRLTVVDGKSIYVYGEGWDFGEVAGNALFTNATQVNMAGTGVGTFNDRLRDAVRGGSPFDEDPRAQGFASGLATDPNDHPAELLEKQETIKLALTGDLRTFKGSGAGFAAQPRESVAFVEAHDNLTLFDALAYKLPRHTPMADRIRMQILALSTTALGQGVMFWHAGAEALRSKSFDADSFNSGDWFNVYDPSGQAHGFGRGLPPAEKNAALWNYAKPLLADATLRPSSADIRAATDQAETLLRLRASSPLFHLATASIVQRKVSFPAGGPGVIVMRIDDTVAPYVDRTLSGVVVVFNATPSATTQTVAGTAGRRFTLSPIQADGPDPIVKTASFTGDSFTVPARTVAVFVAR